MYIIYKYIILYTTCKYIKLLKYFPDYAVKTIKNIKI